MFGGNINDADFYTGAYSRIHDNYGSREGIDWQDEVFGSTGITQNHNVNITGGTEKTKYMISYNYTDEMVLWQSMVIRKIVFVLK